MIIGFDIDGVFADFDHSFVERAIQVTGRDLFGPGFVAQSWNFPEAAGYTKDEISAVWASIKADPDFWMNLPAYGYVQDVVNTVWNHFQSDDVYFVTNRMGLYPKSQTEYWLGDQGFEHPTVLLSAQKGTCAKALSLDVYLDDRYENAVDVAQTGTTRSFLLNRPWNAGMRTEGVNLSTGDLWTITRVDTPMEFLECCQSLR